MNTSMNESELELVAGKFDLAGKILSIESYGSGHINDTFLVLLEKDQEKEQYILQRMNTDIFKKPVELMENIMKVTTHLRKKIVENGGDPSRETLNIVTTKDGKPYYQDETGFWRIYEFIQDAICYDMVEKPEDFYESAVAFGNFQRLLSDFPAKELHETIPNFHNTKDRFKNFMKAVNEDKMGRAKDVQKEIQFAIEHEYLANGLGDMQDAGELPLRVTHNDTKLNNIMMDKDTRKGICVIDLDTVMPGLAVNDFGDSIRFGANTAAEDEMDLSKVSCDLNLFELYTKGFIEGLDGSLTENEIKALPLGAKVMTYECGIRFLGDYLEGDTYFKIHRDKQNLDRARTQFGLVADMEKKAAELDRIVAKYM